MKRLLFVSVPILLLLACDQGTEAYDEVGLSHPLSKVDIDKGPAFRFDPALPFETTLGRGSGRDGLDTIQIGESGAVTIHESSWATVSAAQLSPPASEQALDLDDPFLSGGSVRTQRWALVESKLPQDSIERIANRLAALQLDHLHKGYHAEIFDGTQWILHVRQGTSVKAIYFNNHFPDDILLFAKFIDAEIESLSLQESDATEIKGRNHDGWLWDSIRTSE